MRSELYYLCKADYEAEQVEELRRLRHIDRECTSAICDYCHDEKITKDDDADQ